VPKGVKSRMRRTETPKPIWIKFCEVIDITDVVTHTNFGDHRLRGFGGAGVKFPPLPLTFIVVLAHSRTTVRACDISFSLPTANISHDWWFRYFCLFLACVLVLIFNIASTNLMHIENWSVSTFGSVENGYSFLQANTFELIFTTVLHCFSVWGMASFIW